MTFHHELIPHYFQRTHEGKLVEVVEQRHYELIEFEEIEVNEFGVSKKYLEAEENGYLSN